MNNSLSWPHGTLNYAYDFQEAKNTVDILVNLDPQSRGPSGLGAWFNDLVRLVDHRLIRRCGVYLNSSQTHIGKSQPTQILDEYSELGWEVRILSVPPSKDLLIIDKTNCFSVIGNYSDATMRIDHGADDTPLLLAHFESVWQASSSTMGRELIFEDLIRTIDRSSWKSVVQISTELWDQVFSHIKENPKAVHLLPDRRFEELIAELLVREGLNVQITPKTRFSLFWIAEH